MTRTFTGKRLIAAALLTLSVGASSSLISFADGASAATTKTVAPKLGGPCTTAGATTTVGAKVLTCSKALSGKLTWGTTTTPSLPGGRADGPGGHGPNAGGPNAGGPNGDPAFAAAMAKYTACLKAQGVTLPAFGGRRGFGGAGATPAPRPTLSAKQQAAMTKCASLRPAFGRGFGNGMGQGMGGAAGAAGTPGMGGGFGGGAQLPNTPANVAAYIACLNTNGVNIATLADIAGLDRQSPKIAAALAACRSKRVASN